MPANTWASFYYQTPPSEPISFTSLNLARIGSTIYAGLTIYSSGVGGGVPRRIAQRDLSANWVLSNLPRGAEVALGASQSNLFVLSNRIEELIPFTTDRHNMELFQWPSGFYWLLHQSTVPSASYSPHSPKLPTSQTGVYSFWTHDTFYNNQLNTFYYLQRKPVGLSGSVSYNAFWTGNNWISGRTDIESNAIVRIRNGAVTRILANQWIVVHNGSALICEGGSIIAEPGGEVIVQPGGIYVTCGTHEFLGPGACISTTGGTIQIPDNATLRVNNGGVLFAQQTPGTIELGKNAKIIIDADGTLLWNSNANWIFAENARVEIHGKVKVGAGITLTFPSSSQFECYPGARFEMGNNSTVAVGGQFSVAGDQENPVVFTLQQGASSWNGIVANNSCQANLSLEYCAFDGAANAVLVGEQAHFTMSNCVIENSSIGVQITPYLGDCPVVPAAKYISYNTMTNVGMGIFLNTVAETHINNNIILGQWSSGNQPQELSAGIRCVGSSPEILGNRIEGFGYGLHAMDGSSPELEDGFSGGHNVIRNNYIGVKCQDESHPVLGFLSGAQWDEGGQNSIYGNDFYDVLLVGKSIVFAQNNWWGSPEDPSHQFSIEDGSELFYEPWLEEDPNQGNRPFAGGTSLQQGKENGDPRLSPFPDMMRQALGERGRRQHGEALNLLRGLVSNRQVPEYARRWAVSQLVAVAQRLPNSAISSFLRAAETAYPSLVLSIRAALPQGYVSERSVSQALACYDANIQRYPNSDIERRALYGGFSLALFNSGDTNRARAAYSTLATRYSSSTERHLAETQLAAFSSRISSPSGQGQNVAFLGKEKYHPEALPSDFALYQNFPNPFNPSTAITFSLPMGAHVTLKVFDVMGREVHTLVNDVREAGNHQVQFDASDLASGVYFYRMQAGPVNIVKRLLLLK